MDERRDASDCDDTAASDADSNVEATGGLTSTFAEMANDVPPLDIEEYLDMAG